MLTPDQIAALLDRVFAITDPINELLLWDIARRISEAGQLTSTAAYQIWRAQNLGLSQREIKKRLQALLKVSAGEIERLLTQSAEVGYRFDLSLLPHAEAVPFAENPELQQLVSAAVELAEEDFTNLTQTLGMVDPYGKALPLQDVYRKCADFAFEQVFTGAADYNTAIRRATRNLARYGVRTIDYESGVHTSLEAAVRRDILGGLGLMQEKISQADHDRLGCDGWEITAHANSAPDHEPIQGKQYGDAEYKALNDSLVRRIGTLNCGHAAFPIILGVNTPQYTPEELEKLRADNEKGVTVDGRHYTGYQATQKQRDLERAIRAQKRKVMVDEASGDSEKLKEDKARLTRLRQEYKRFSKAAGLRTQEDRLFVAGFGRKRAKAAEPLANGGTPQNGSGTASTPTPVQTPAAMPEPTQRPAAPVDVLEEYRQTATPGVGEITYDEGFDLPRYPREVNMAHWLRDTFGGDIKVLKDVNEDHVVTPDYEWRGKLWDLKSISTEKAANSAVRHGLHQIENNPGGIILDSGVAEISMESLAAAIEKRMKWYVDPNVDIMIVSNNKAISVIRYRKK